MFLKIHFYFILICIILASCKAKVLDEPHQKENISLEVSIGNIHISKDGISFNTKIKNISKSVLYIFPDEFPNGSNNLEFLVKLQNNETIIFGNYRATFNGKFSNVVKKIDINDSYNLQCFLTDIQNANRIIGFKKGYLTLVSNVPGYGRIFIGQKFDSNIQIKAIYKNNWPVQQYSSDNFGIINLWIGRVESEWFICRPPN